MSEVKRFKPVINSTPYKHYAYCEENEEGIYVRIDDYEALKAQRDALERENILLKQGCENNPLVHEMIDWRERTEAAEGELAGLEKQSDWIFEQCESDNCQNGAVVNVIGADAHLCAECSRDKKYSRMKITALPKRITHPAPAVSLAELVPCPYPCGWNDLLSHSMADAAFLASGLVEDEPVSTGQRESVVLNNDRLIKVITAILRNIEEAK